MDRMEEATAALQQTPSAVEKAKTSLEEGMTSLKTRQKHIRIVDRSEYGWAAVEEYVEDELADGEDDEKRIQRVDFRAGKKLKSVKGAKNKKGSGPDLSPAKNLSKLVPTLGEGLPVMGPWRSIAYSR